MRLVVICSLLSLSFSALATGKPVVSQAVTKKICGYLKPQAAIEQTPTTACLVGIEGLENERLALYSAFDAKVYEINDADIKFSTNNSVTMPAKTIGRIPGVLAHKDVQDRFIASKRKSETAEVTFQYEDKTMKGISVKLGEDFYEFENLATPTK